MNFDDIKLDFLMQRPDDLEGLISNRAIICLKNDGYRTVFSMIRHKANELWRIPNMGKKSLEQFIELVRSHGLEAGDTAEFFELNQSFFMCDGTRKIEKTYGVYTGIPEKEISNEPTSDKDKIFIDDYRARVKDFLTPSLSYQMRVGVHGNTQLALETSYYMSLLPAHLRDKITPEFARAAFHTMEVEAELSGPQEHLRQILIKAVEQKLG